MIICCKESEEIRIQISCDLTFFNYFSQVHKDADHYHFAQIKNNQGTYSLSSANRCLVDVSLLFDGVESRHDHLNFSLIMM